MPGQLCSKSNSRRIVSIGGVSAVIKSHEALVYARSFKTMHQVQSIKTYIDPVRLTASVYYKDLRRDLDIALLQDCIQNCGILRNDRQVREIHAFRFVDRNDPRTEFIVEAL